ncbi:MAG TPA: acyl-CoA dehydrogenase C-terminal domain-containing protein [Geminicoccaceae bacterium]|jgi:alkylation response protein AidB-like acyl-CoA dehydrogenase|nr:acyl-CoA dehydrogenase C-terminal domain-containing protein [Geminicoccaceae bacterium]
MTTYRAPQRDMRFVLHELLEVEKLSQLPGYEEATADVIDAVVEEGARFCEDMLFPINRTGDEQGCMYENGVVRTPAGFKKAYDRFVEGGWMGLAADPAHGGQGLPKAIKLVMDEMVCSANLAFSNYPGLSASAYLAIDAHAGDDLKARYLPKLASGAWSGTMCLTEPQCGTDLGLIRTRAEPNDDGTYAITGTKIFITSGEHDLTENIVHLVLARLPEAPKGTRGISLFLVPKLLPRDDGTPGPRNGVTCAGIEHKMGINGSATCVMNFEGATGWLLGEPHRGMRAMFTMMNDARLDVGLQGLAIAETAYQSAVAYARERLQGRALSGATQPDQPADPIIVHPDVRRMLLTMRASSEGARALAYWIGMALDLARRQPDAAARQTADDLIALMTPIIKAYFTDQGSACANLGVQVMGGHGYIRECGMEQLVRDARITQLYEGANGIQALDLVGRKLPAHFGRHLRAFFHPVMAFIEQHQADPELAEFVLPLAKAYARLQQVTLHLAQQGLRDPNEAAAASYDYLRLFALVALAYLWARMVQVAKAKLAAGADGDAAFYEAKVKTARFFMTKMLPESGALLAQIMAGGKPLMDFEEAAF